MEAAMRLTGFDAIEFAEKAGMTLNKAADNIDSPAIGLSIAEAEAIADDRPELIWLDVDDDEYYGQPRNMEPGGEPTRPPRLAGQRADELLPGQSSGSRMGRHAAGTPAGGLASGGLGGTNAGDGSPENADLEEAMGSGPDDHSGDSIPDNEPQSGRRGGAIGGTPAGKRRSPK
jgi:hypothetical protein